MVRRRRAGPGRPLHEHDRRLTPCSLDPRVRGDDAGQLVLIHRPCAHLSTVVPAHAGTQKTASIASYPGPPHHARPRAKEHTHAQNNADQERRPAGDHGRPAPRDQTGRPVHRGQPDQAGRPESRAAADGRRGARPQGPHRHPRPGQHPPPHVPEPHPRGAGGPGRRAVQLADQPLPDLGAADPGDDPCLHPDRHGRADPFRLHHLQRPPVHLPQRLQAGRQHPRRRRDRHALPRRARQHERRPQPGRPAAGFGGGEGSRHPQGIPAPDRGLSRRLPRLDAAGGGGAVLAVLGEPRPDARSRGAGAQLRRIAAHPPGGKRQRHRLQPREVRHDPGRVRRGPRLGRP
ncbi:hypothetical protein FQZ97_543680 [compost metagenome]